MSYVQRKKAGQILHTEYGIGSDGPGFLAKLAVRGIGPEYHLCGRVALYEEAKLHEFAREFIGKPARSAMAHQFQKREAEAA